MNLPGTLKISGGTSNFMFGRVFYNGNYQVGKLHAGPSIYGLYIQIPNTNGTLSFTTGFEVLTCLSKSAASLLPCGEYFLIFLLKKFKN